jgi:hypothetical protein
VSSSVSNFVRKVLIIPKMFCVAFRGILLFYIIILDFARPLSWKDRILPAVRASSLNMFVSVCKTSRSFPRSNVRTRNDRRQSNLRKVGRLRPGNNGLCVSRTDIKHLMASCETLPQTAAGQIWTTWWNVVRLYHKQQQDRSEPLDRMLSDVTTNSSRTVLNNLIKSRQMFSQTDGPAVAEYFKTQRPP